MATLREYFQTDFGNALTYSFSWNTSDAIPVSVDVKVGIETYSSAKFIAFFVPHHPQSVAICKELLFNGVADALKKSNDVRTIAQFVGDIQYGTVGSDKAPFSNRVYLYAEDISDQTPNGDFEAIATQKGLWLTVRGQEYVKKKMVLERPLAFICHDTRDKGTIALPIAMGLLKMMCPVWYDEFSLKIGDSLRESIERGLKETRKCILVITPNFLSNTGWTKVEFNSVFTREILEKQTVFMPVWHSVSAKEVYDYSPSLADKVAIDWKLGENEVINKLYRAVTAT
ncbi:MAG: toll/interleukin-1 receptor domain-containing protein [Xanthobacteraceae bacterium]